MIFVWSLKFYHKPVRSCSILAKKKARFYVGFGVSQTPILRTIIGGELHGKILILSVSDNEEHILEKILKVVESSADVEDRTLPSEKIELADLQILLPEKMVYRNGQEISLNRHEFDTLVYLARHPGWVRSKEQIYEAVWTEEVEV